MTKHWFVFYTKSRHEKKVKDLLEKRGVEVFLPMQKVMRQWSDRKKKVEVPLFNSYIFVNIAAHETTDILQTPGVSWIIRHNGKPAVLHAKEYDTIQRFLSSGIFLETEGISENFSFGDSAQVIDGPLKGMTGTITGSSGNQKFAVHLEGINQLIRVFLPGTILKKV